MKVATYQIQISLKGSKPKIWRRILVPSDLLLSDFHKVIQSVVGWTNSHLHQFIHKGSYYTYKMEGDDYWEEMNNVDYKDFVISDLLKKVTDKMVYEYDFGDGWEHNIVLEEIGAVGQKLKFPVCLAGKMECPPEDCGGVSGYLSMLEILKQPDHEEYDSYITWLGGSFDPGAFNVLEINEMLQSKNFGVEEYEDDFY